MNIPQCQRKWFAGVLVSAGNPPGVWHLFTHWSGPSWSRMSYKTWDMITTNLRFKAQHLADPYSKLVSLNTVSSHWGNFRRSWRLWPTGVTKAVSPHHRGIVESTHRCLARCDHNTPGKFQKLWYLETWVIQVTETTNGYRFQNWIILIREEFHFLEGCVKFWASAVWQFELLLCVSLWSATSETSCNIPYRSHCNDTCQID